jgi:hypothetical protein
MTVPWPGLASQTRQNLKLEGPPLINRWATLPSSGADAWLGMHAMYKTVLTYYCNSIWDGVFQVKFSLIFCVS